MALSGVWCLLTAGWLLLWGSKKMEYNSSIRTEKYTEWPNNQTLNNQTEQIEWSRADTNKIEQLMNNKTCKEQEQILIHWAYTEGWVVTVQCLQGLHNIFVITELTIATLFAWVLVMRHQMSSCRFLCSSSGLTCGLLKNHSQKLCCLTPNTPV
jgi:hypothetical protein